MRALKHLLLILISLCIFATSNAAEMCSSVFADEGPYQNLALDAALKKAITKSGDIKGLSSNDLKFLVEKVFDKQQGQQYQIKHYWRMNADQRTVDLMMRQIGEEVTHKGLERYFEEHGLLKEKSRLFTKLQLINRSKTFNVFQTLWISFAAASKGTPPVMLPEIFFEMKKADKDTLMMKGFDSVEGKEIAARYKFKQEGIRGYTIVSKYYSRIAIAVLGYFLYEKTKEELHKHEEEQSDIAFAELMKRLEEMFGGSTKETKEDILLENVVKKFIERYGRTPDANERALICTKVYGPQGCPQ
ncbi:hypothetical protein DOE51_16800 [Bdellovibrio sp. NC01]|nr:hypothetical protein DOE51_16800 [Bdellovibrio sp. NC01]